MKLTVLDSAKKDLADLRKYVTRHKPEGTWREIKAQVKDKILQLENFPFSCSRPPELLGFPDRYRQHLTSQQRIIYEIASDEIFIHVVCGMPKISKSF
jgi:toxin ParE1/3/4